jgi:hypothetical protein
MMRMLISMLLVIAAALLGETQAGNAQPLIPTHGARSLAEATTPEAGMSVLLLRELAAMHDNAEGVGGNCITTPDYHAQLTRRHA